MKKIYKILSLFLGLIIAILIIGYTIGSILFGLFLTPFFLVYSFLNKRS